MKEFIYKKLIYYFVMLSPIIDIITSFMIKNNINLTIGIISKMLILVLAGIYLVFLDKKNRKINILVMTIVFAFSILNIMNNKEIISGYLFTYFSYLFKYIYHIIILLFFIRVLKEYPIKMCDIRIPLFITVFCYLLAYITQTDFQSYANSVTKVGSSGWYSSANELGNLLCLFFPVALYNAFENKDGIKFDIIISILIGICMLMIGTKVGLLGYFLVIIAYLVARLIFIKHYKLNKKYLIAIFMLIVPLLLLNNLPAVRNIKYIYSDSNDLNYVINSGRDNFKDELKTEYKNSDSYSKAIGKTYISDIKGEKNILIAEQDFYDISYMYGFLGIIILISLYAITYLTLIKKVYGYYKQNNSVSKKSITILIAISLELLIAFISGHSLLSPSVSTYLTLFAAISINLEFKNEKNVKTRILIGSKDKMYKKIDSSNYEITILSPEYQENKTYEIIKINQRNKIKPKILNKLVAYLSVKNQKYDYAFTSNQNSDFENNYIIYSDAHNKLNIKDKLAKKILTKGE